MTKPKTKTQENVDACHSCAAGGGIAIPAMSLPHPKLASQTAKAVGGTLGELPMFGKKVIFGEEFKAQALAAKFGTAKSIATAKKCDFSRIPALDDLELYEILVAAFPEKFADRDEAGDDLWDEVQDFAEELCDNMEVPDLCQLLARLVMLSSPMQTAIRGELVHALGTVEIQGDRVMMTGGAKRPVIAS